MPWHLLATSAVVYNFIVQGTITAGILSDPGLQTTKEDFLACQHAEVLFVVPHLLPQMLSLLECI